MFLNVGLTVLKEGLTSLLPKVSSRSFSCVSTRLCLFSMKFKFLLGLCSIVCSSLSMTFFTNASHYLPLSCATCAVSFSKSSSQVPDHRPNRPFFLVHTSVLFFVTILFTLNPLNIVPRGHSLNIYPLYDSFVFPCTPLLAACPLSLWPAAPLLSSVQLPFQTIVVSSTAPVLAMQTHSYSANHT